MSFAAVQPEFTVRAAVSAAMATATYDDLTTRSSSIYMHLVHACWMSFSDPAGSSLIQVAAVQQPELQA